MSLGPHIDLLLVNEIQKNDVHIIMLSLLKTMVWVGSMMLMDA